MELIPQRNCHILVRSNWKEWILCSETLNRLFATSHSRGTKPPRWRAKVALGQDKQKTNYIILDGNFLCLSCPSATFALQHGGFVPREWLAAKGLLGLAHTSATHVQTQVQMHMQTRFTRHAIRRYVSPGLYHWAVLAWNRWNRSFRTLRFLCLRSRFQIRTQAQMQVQRNGNF